MVEVNIADEIHRLVTTKYWGAMDELLEAQNIIDGQELRTFDSYTWRNRHLSERTGIPNYEKCWKPLPPDYFEE